MREETSVDAEARAPEVVLVEPVAPVVLVEPAPAAPVVPVEVLVLGCVVVSLAIVLLVLGCCAVVSVLCCCCDVVSLATLELVPDVELAPVVPEVLLGCVVVSLATDELRSVLLVVLVSVDGEVDDGVVEAVVLLVLGCCCDVVSEE